MDKLTLRKKFLAQRLALTDAEWQEKSQKICETIQALPEFIQAKTVLAYISHRKEPDLTTLFKDNDKAWGLPRCEGKNLAWYQCHPIHEQNYLQPDRYGILAPQANLSKLRPEQVELILIPCIALDHRGYRLGYGGGYYDRLLSNPKWQHCFTIGIAFDFNVIDQLPHETWDIKIQKTVYI